MNKDFIKLFLALVRLRYKLIWAHARTDNGKTAMLFAVYLIGGLFALFFALGGLGMGAAISAIEPEQAEYFARWILTGLFINGIGLSLLFGAGPRTAFSDQALRRYPLDGRGRFFVRQLIGILDPIWMMLIAATMGLAVGFLWLAGGSIIRTLLAVLLFIAVNYLATIVLLTVVGMIMETRKGAGILGTIVLLLVSFGPLSIAVLLKTHKTVVWNAMDMIVSFAPSGAAAEMIMAESLVRALSGFILLLLWCVVLLWLLEKLEMRPATVSQTTAGDIVWQDAYDQLGTFFGNRYAPLVSKSLRYHMRCNMIRFSLLSAPVIMLASKYIKFQGYFFISLMMFFIMSSATAAAMMLNAFGYDDAGIRRYAILPMRFVDALQASSISSLILRGAVIFISFALWLMFYNGDSLSWQMLAMMLSTALASLFLFNAAGFWTSVLSPKIMDFDAMWNNRLSFGAITVIMLGVMIPSVGLMLLANHLNQASVVRFWWVSFLAMIACLGIYVASFRVIEKLLNPRRERLINYISGARDR